MGKITAQFMKERFDEIVGWPYKSPGTNDENGIDCSGAFVRAYQKGGKSIYHGSNRIEREYCRDCFDLNGQTTELEVGMAIFKYKEPSESGYDATGLQKGGYLQGGEHYNGDMRDYSHIGLVTGITPLRITHATGPMAKVDTKLGSGIHAWRRAGWLKAVDYTESNTEGGITVAMYDAKVTAESGESVRMRPTASTEKPWIAEVPVGSYVQVLKETNAEWRQINYGGMTGYMMTKFLQKIPDAESGAYAGTEDETGSARYRVCVYFDNAEAASAFYSSMKQARVEQS